MDKEEPFVTYNYPIKNLTKHMKTIRIIFGLSLDELASILGITRATLLKYESGSKSITPVMFLAIRGALFDVAERVNHEEYYKLLWYLFIEDITSLNTVDNDQFLAKATIDQIKSNISNFVFEIYEKRNRGTPLWQIGLDIQKEIRERFAYIL